MENFIKILLSTVIAEGEGISLNSNILETGLINIVLLIGILIYSGKDFLTNLLEERKTNIVNGIQDAEQRLNEASLRLNEAQKQLNQAEIVIDQIKADTLKTKTVLLKSELAESKKNLTIRFGRALAAFKTKERQIFLEIKQEILTLVLERTVVKIQQIFTSKKQANRFTIKSIGNLEGDLL